MRKGNSDRFFTNVARAALLAICFAVVFAVALTGGIFDINAAGDNVAYAIHQMGDSSGTVTADNGEVTFESLNFPGSGKGTRSWVSQEVRFIKTDFAPYVSLASEKDQFNTASIYNSGSINGGYRVDGKLGGNIFSGGNTLVALFNYTLPDDIVALASLGSSNLEVKIEVTLSMAAFDNKQQDWERCGYLVKVTDTPQTADSHVYGGHDDRKNAGYKGYQGDNNDWKDYTFDVVLNGSANNLMVAMAWGEQYGSCIAEFSNLRLKYVVTLKDWTDGADTIINDKAAPSATSITAEPYITEVGQYGGWTTSNETIAKALGNALDEVSVASNRVVLKSYAGSKLGNINNTDYYKKVSLEYVDNYNYDGKGNIVGDSADPNYASGLKTLTAGNATFNLWETSNATQSLTVDGIQVGAVSVLKVNRARVKVELYFSADANVNVSVADYGGLSSTTTVNVSGIDTTAPDALQFNAANNENYLTDMDAGAFDGAALNWIIDSVQRFSPEYGSWDGAPYAWYYDVKFSADKPMSDWFVQQGSWQNNPDLLKGKMPFAVGNISGFNFNFAQGKTDDGILPLSYDEGVQPKGPGYYLFTFYVMDLAGNVCAVPSSYVMKVDNAAPAEFAVDVRPDGVSLDGDYASVGKWAKEYLEYSLGWKVSLSGNKLEFATPDGTEYMLYFSAADDAEQKIVKITRNGSDVDLSGGNGWSNDSVSFEYSVSGGFATLVVKVTDKDDMGERRILDGGTVFTVRNNGVDTDNMYGDISAVDGNWRYGDVSGRVAMRLDTAAPDLLADYFSDDGGYLQSAGEGAFSVSDDPDARNWYTSAWDIDTLLTFSDDTKYASQIKLYFGLKNFTVGGEIAAFDKQFREQFASAQDYDALFLGAGWDWSDNAKDYIYTYYNLRNGEKGFKPTSQGSDSYSYTFDLDPQDGRGAGVRIIYIWAVDQAGNASGLYAYGIYTDANDYQISFAVDSKYSAKFGGDLLDAHFVNAGNEEQSYYKRGEDVYLVVDRIKEGFAPYQIKKNDKTGSQPVVIYTNDGYGQSLEGGKIEESYGKYAAIDGTDRIRFAVDRISLESLPIGEDRVANITMSFRQCVVVNMVNTSVPYTSAAVDPKSIYTVSAQAGELVGEELLRGGIHVYFFNKDSADPIEAPRNVGEYKVAVRLEDGGSDLTSYYVLSGQENILGFNKIEFFITKGRLTVTLGGASVFGEEIDVTFELSGLAGSDLTAWTDEGIFPGTVGKYGISYKGVLYGGNSGKNSSTLPANSYSFSYTGYSADNYDIIVEQKSDYYVVSPYALTATAQAAAKVYGDADPENYSFLIDKNVYERFQNELGTDIFGNVVSETLSEDGQRYVITVRSADMPRALGEDVRKDGYAFTSISDTGIGLNGNFTIAFAAEGNGVFTITQRTVSILPEAGQRIFGETPEELAKIVYSFENPDDGRFASEISGYLGVTTAEGESKERFVTLGTLAAVNPDNIKIELANKEVIITVYDGDDVVTLTWKGGALETVFGTLFDESRLQDTYNYEIAGGLWEEGDTLTLSVNIRNYSGKLSDVGVYVIDFTVTYMKGDDDLSDLVNIVGANRLTVVPVTVTVTPEITGSDSKVYGSLDEWQFGFEFEGVPDGYTFDKSKLNVALVRALFSQNGEFVREGARYDDVVPANGGYYGVYARTFDSADPNVKVVWADGAPENLRLAITPKEINLDTLGADKFNGINKPTNDGSASVPYDANGKRTAINITGELVNGDSVWLDFAANYYEKNGQIWVNTGEPTEERDRFTNLDIRFSDFVLKGDKAGNYRIVCAEGYVTVSGSGADEFYIVNVVELHVSKSDFSVSKIYDGTTLLNDSHVRFAAGTDIADWNGVVLTGRMPVFGSRNAGDNYIVTLEFLIPNATVESVIFEGATGDLTLREGSGGVVLTVANVKAVIARRVIGIGEITFDIASEKIYDGTANVTVGYVFADGVVQTGDTRESIGASFTAAVGNKNVTVTDDGYAAQTALFDTAEITNANYELGFTADELNARYSGEDAFGVTVTPAELVLEFEFDTDKIYDGDETLVKGEEFSSVNIAVKTPVSGWETEKKDFSVNLDDARYYYSDAEGNSYPYVQVDVEGNAVRHDVTADNIVFNVSADGSFIASNYTFYGVSFKNGVSVKATALGVAPMAKREIKPVLNEIKAVDKVYDGTKNAEGSVDFSAMINGLDIPERDKESLAFSFDAVFNDANAGGNKTIAISNISIAIGGENKAVESSYKVTLQNTTFTLQNARITPAPLAVEFALPDKVYNGRMFDGVDEEVIDAAGGYVKFNGFFLDDGSYYDILVRAAGYNYVNVDKSDVKDGVEAYVYGFRLTDNRKPSADPSELNYYPVFASLEAELAGYTPVERTAALPETDEEGRSLYYYEFNTGSYYKVPTESLSSLSDEELVELAKCILAAYDDLDTPTEVTGSTPTLLVSKNVPSEIMDKIASYKEVEAVYGAASGNITPASLKWTADIVDGTTLTKTFDDTDKYYGKYIARDNPDNDFTIDLGGEYGFLIQSVTGRFEQAGAGNRLDIIFTVHLYDSETSVPNYTINDSYTVRGKGRIDKAAMSVSLATNNAKKDAFEFAYGDTPTFEFVYKYNDKTVIVNGGAAYMAVEDYKAAFAPALDASDYASRLYTLTDGQFIQASDGQYVRLNGTFGEVSAVTEATSVSDVGSYTLDGVKGSADNFAFDAAGNSVTIKVVPADIAVTVKGEADGDGYYYTMEYGVGSLPVPDFNLVGFRNGDTAADLAGFSDKYGFYLYGQNGKGERVENAFVRISSALEAGEYYALGIENGAVVGNYKIVFSEDGASAYKLNVVRPVITGVTADDGKLTVPYDGDNHKMSDGAAVLALLTGIGADGSYSAAIDWTDDPASVTDAGQYRFVITVNRTIAGDNYGYGYAPLSIEGVFTVRQRNVTLSVGQTSFTYNGKEQTAPIVFGGEGMADGDEELASNLKITYGGAAYMLGVGSYALGLEGALGGNYAVADNITGGRLSVNPAVITVAVDKTSEKQSLTDEGAGIAYSYSLADASLSGLIDESKFSVRYTYGGASYTDAVHEAGVYSYNVLYDDANFKTAGGVGTLRVVKDTVVFGGDDGVCAVVKLPEEVAVPYSLSYGEIFKEGNAQASDDVYWNTVDGYVQGTFTNDKETASVLGVLGIRLSDGRNVVTSLGAPVEVSVKLPAGVGANDGFRLYTVRDGGLTEITDYTVGDDGFVTYTSDYIGNIVFVEIAPVVLPFWIWILVGALGALIIAGIILGAVASRHRAAEAAGAGVKRLRKPSHVNNDRKPPIIGIK